MYNVYTNNTLNTVTLPGDSNLVNISLFDRLESKIDFRSFSIKYVGSGMEKYTVNKKPYVVKENHYLIANKYNEGRVEIQSDKTVRGICIDVAPSLISDAVMGHVRPDTTGEAQVLDSFFNSEAFAENLFSCGDTSLGKRLMEVDTIISSAPFDSYSFANDFYFTLAECIVKDYVPVFRQLQNIRSIKWSTKKDLYQRVLRGRSYLDSCLTEVSTVEAAALESGMSQYHFFRLFKSVFGISPCQYVIGRKMRMAMQLLSQGDISISDISVKLGYYDVPAFSKAFKKIYGLPPSEMMN